MVRAEIASIRFNWCPNIVIGDDPQIFQPQYVISNESSLTEANFRTNFANLPSANIWEDRTESDDELLEQLGGGC